ncbi:MAG: GDP-L-fucose synthase family protein [Candidatus Hodarchaeales archaeon]|jgi:GDP-L-fucose synthase
MEISNEWPIFVTGHSGMVGKSLIQKLKAQDYTNLLVQSSSDLDLRNQNNVMDFFRKTKPKVVIHLAARVGGILANIKQPANFIYDNLMMQSNVIHAAHVIGVKKLVFLGSSCIYPKESPQPMREEYYLSGKLEPTNQSYAVAKIAGIQMCSSYSSQYGDNFITPLPCNLYGPGDHYASENSHVLAALISRFHEAKMEERDKVTVWGSGEPKREFLYVDDLAEAIIFLLKKYESPEIINVGSGTDIKIKNLANMVKRIVGYSGEIVFDKSKPDGMMQKLLDITKINNLGWSTKTSLEEGIRKSYRLYTAQREES